MEQEDKNLLDSEVQSKLTIESRSSNRAHSTEHGSGDDEAITEINVTPLVDVALVLVIIFMAVSPFMVQASLQVSESRAGAATGKSSLSENIQIELSGEDQILVNQIPVSLADLPSVLKEKLPQTKDRLVTLQAEKTNSVGQVVEILDIAKQSGAQKVAILNKTADDELKTENK